MKTFRAVGIAAVLLAAAACGQSPTAPGSAAAVSAGSVAVESCGGSVTVLAASAENGFVRVRNDNSCAQVVGVAIFVGDALHLRNFDSVAPGATVDIRTPVPACGAYRFVPYVGDDSRPLDASRFTTSTATSTDWCR